MKRYIVALVLASQESEGYDLFLAVGARGKMVSNPTDAHRFKSLKRALNTAQDFATVCEIVRVIEIEE